MIEMTKFKFCATLWAALKESEFYHLFVRRLVRVVARETFGTYDGIKLASLASKILQRVIPGINLRPLKGRKEVLEHMSTYPRGEGAITAESFRALWL